MTQLLSGNNPPVFALNGWLADYPDPDNFLRQSDAIFRLKAMGWQDAGYEQMVEEANRMHDRGRRMALYRQADRQLVAEQALVLPLYYFMETQLIKPWMKNCRENLLGFGRMQNMIIEEH
jgi:oligopeptide transport system substrate-binding protein